MPRFVGQAEFGGGIFRGRRAPRDSVYDAANALVDDERLLYRRGGVAYKSSAAAANTLAGVWASETWQGHRVVCWDNAGLLYAIDSDGVSLHELSSGSIFPDGQQFLGEFGPEVPSETGQPYARPVAIGGMILFRSWRQVEGDRNCHLIAYAGSRRAKYETGTVTITNGSPTVTGAGTAWVTNVEPGMMFQTSSTDGSTKIVKSVDSDTQITLTEPWTASGGAGSSYAIGDAAGFDYNSIATTFNPGEEIGFSIGSVGAPPRLLLGLANRLYFSPPGSIVIDSDDYHEFPHGSQIRGISDLRDSAMVFTDDGMWGVSNMELDALDDFGNIQHRIDRISQDMILWGEQGIAGYAGQLLVPCRDDVFVVTPEGAPAPLTRSVRPLYRRYVREGFRPGLAEVYRGHYMLPIVSADGLTVEDVLTCRLDLLDSRGNARPAWTRQEDQAASPSYARSDEELLAVDGPRITDLTDIFDPSSVNARDVDGTVHALRVVTSDFEAGAIDHSFTGGRVALEVAEGGGARENLATNPKAGAGATTGWATIGTPVDFAAGTLGAGGFPAVGGDLTGVGITTGFKVEGDLASDGAELEFAVEEGVEYLVALYLNVDDLTGDAAFEVDVRDDAFDSKASVVLTAAEDEDAGWLRRGLAPFTAEETGTYTLRLRQLNTGTCIVYWTGVLIEGPGLLLNSYFDGDSAGASWSGTPEESTSSLPVDEVTFEVEYASGPVAGEVWTSAGSRAATAAEEPETFRFSRRARAVRLRITTTGAAVLAVLRSVEAVFRERGRS